MLASRSRDGVNYVDQNINYVAMQSTLEAKTLAMERSHLAHDIHSEEVRNKKEDGKLSQHKWALFMVSRWEFLKQKRREF